MSEPLAGRVALVTGAGRRLGRALALGLAADGAELLIHVHTSVEAGRALVAELAARGGRAELIAADLASHEGVERLADAARAAGVDLLVASAASFVRRGLAETDPETWDGIFALNARAPVLLAERVGRRLRELGRSGRIVLIGDAAGLVPWRGYAVHSLAKAVLAPAARLLAVELAPYVTVNVVAPGPILPAADQDAAARRRSAERTLLGRWGRVEEVVDLVRYLVGPTGGYVTGATIPVDGGRHLLGHAPGLGPGLEA